MKWMLFGLLASQVSWGFILRAEAIPLKAGYRGSLPQVRLEDDGRIVIGHCRSHCTWHTMRQLTPFQIEVIKNQVSSVPREASLKRWYSRAFCASQPPYQFRFDADDGEVFLGVGDICLGGGVENSNARGLISLLGRDLPETDRD